MYLNGSFDGGSSPYQSWVATLEFARELGTKYHHPLRLTYFVTTAFYDPAVTGSAVGKAASRDEVLVRWALTQQAINEGHEIANHTVRHQDGSAWTAAQWRAELSEYQALVTRNLFQPVRDERGVPVDDAWKGRRRDALLAALLAQVRGAVWALVSDNDALLARFRDHTMKLFTKHGMSHLAYWTPVDADKGAGTKLIYILAHDSKEAGLASFEAFRADPDWIKAKTESEKDGSLTIEPRSEGVKSVYMTATDFSPIQ